MERKTEAEMASYELHFNFKENQITFIVSYQVVIRKIFLNHYIFYTVTMYMRPLLFVHNNKQNYKAFIMCHKYRHSHLYTFGCENCSFNKSFICCKIVGNISTHGNVKMA